MINLQNILTSLTILAAFGLTAFLALLWSFNIVFFCALVSFDTTMHTDALKPMQTKSNRIILQR